MTAHHRDAGDASLWAGLSRSDLRSNQWHAVTASFLGWTLDAFDLLRAGVFGGHAGDAVRGAGVEDHPDHDGDASDHPWERWCSACWPTATSGGGP